MERQINTEPTCPLGYHGKQRGPGSRVPRLDQDGALISNSIHSPCSLEGSKVEMVEMGIVHVRCKRLHG